MSPIKKNDQKHMHLKVSPNETQKNSFPQISFFNFRWFWTWFHKIGRSIIQFSFSHFSTFRIPFTLRAQFDSNGPWHSAHAPQFPFTTQKKKLVTTKNNHKRLFCKTSKVCYYSFFSQMAKHCQKWIKNQPIRTTWLLRSCPDCRSALIRSRL